MARCQWMPSERMELNKVIWASSHLLRFHLCSRDYFFWNSPKANMVGCWWMLFFGRNCLLNSMSIEPSSGLRLYTFSVYFASFVVKWLHSIGQWALNMERMKRWAVKPRKSIFEFIKWKFSHKIVDRSFKYMVRTYKIVSFWPVFGQEFIPSRKGLKTR